MNYIARPQAATKGSRRTEFHHGGMEEEQAEAESVCG